MIQWHVEMRKYLLPEHHEGETVGWSWLSSSFWKGIMRASISHCCTAIMKPRWAGLARPPAQQEQFAHLKVLCPRRLLPYWLHSDFLSHRMPLTVSPQHLADSYNFPTFSFPWQLLAVCLTPPSIRWQLDHGFASAFWVSIVAQMVTGGCLLPTTQPPSSKDKL